MGAMLRGIVESHSLCEVGASEVEVPDIAQGCPECSMSLPQQTCIVLALGKLQELSS
jgi:hypothetical protein